MAFGLKPRRAARSLRDVAVFRTASLDIFSTAQKGDSPVLLRDTH
jgi:hypothetical protein